MVAPRALVAGGSLGGLLAGNLLLRAGWDVTIHERVAGPLDGRGAGLATHRELHEILWRAGVPRDAALGVWVDLRRVVDRQGGVVGELPLRQCFTGWSRLYQLLLDAFPAERRVAGNGVVSFTDHPDHVNVKLANGTRRDVELLVAADGIRSSIRAKLAPAVQPQYAGYVAWRGLVDERVLPPHVHRALFEEFAFCLPDREQMLGYPVAGAHDDITPGRRRYNFVWYRPADEATELARLCTDATGKVHEGAIPPPLIRAEVVAELRQAARDLLSPEFAAIVAHTPDPFFQPIYDVEAPRMAFGRVALLGDAAFVARPHCGMGVTKAAADAVELVDALAATDNDIAAALAIYDKARVAFGYKVVAHARHLGAYMQAQLKSEHERAMAERYRTPEAVMRETAIPLVD